MISTPLLWGLVLSGHTTEQSLTVYRELALTDVADEYEKAMQTFPIR